jgi:uncharacterized protein with WD repeat
VDETALHFLDLDSRKETLQIINDGVSAIQYSPLGSYVVGCSKWIQGQKNLIVWDTKSGSEVAAFEFRNNSKDGPKMVKFTNNEGLFAHQTAKAIHILDVENNFKLKCEIKIPACGFEFVPLCPDIPAKFCPVYFLAWKTQDALSEKEEGGTVVVYDLNKPEKPKFSIVCTRA